MNSKQERAGTRKIIRWMLSGPVAVIVAIIALMGMPIYIPAGAGNVDNLVIPLLLFRSSGPCCSLTPSSTAISHASRLLLRLSPEEI